MPPQINAATELASLPFDTIIASPLVAVIRAQSTSAKSTLEFVDSCIDKTTHEVKNVSFNYVKTYDSDAGPREQRNTLSVPILTMVQVPFLRVEEVTLQFNVKLSSHDWDKSSSDYKVGTSVSGGFGIGGLGVKLSGSFAFSRKNDKGAEVTREHSLAIWVKAVQDQMPAGMERILSVLESAIREQPAAQQPANEAPVIPDESPKPGKKKPPSDQGQQEPTEEP